MTMRSSWRRARDRRDEAPRVNIDSSRRASAFFIPQISRRRRVVVSRLCVWRETRCPVAPARPVPGGCAPRARSLHAELLLPGLRLGASRDRLPLEPRSRSFARARTTRRGHPPSHHLGGQPAPFPTRLVVLGTAPRPRSAPSGGAPCTPRRARARSRRPSARTTGAAPSAAPRAASPRVARPPRPRLGATRPRETRRRGRLDASRRPPLGATRTTATRAPPSPRSRDPPRDRAVSAPRERSPPLPRAWPPREARRRRRPPPG